MGQEELRTLMGELSLRMAVVGAPCFGGCVEVFGTADEDITEDDASRLLRACSSCSSLILDFSSSTLIPFLFAETQRQV